LQRSFNTACLSVHGPDRIHPLTNSIAIRAASAGQPVQRQVSKLWNGRRNVELRLLGYAAQDFEFLRYFPGLELLNVGRLKDNKAIAAMFPEEMHRVVYYTITPGTCLRRPTP
jgi:hypothetical protein